MSCTDLAVSFPVRGVIRLSSHTLFGDTYSPTCRRIAAAAGVPGTAHLIKNKSTASGGETPKGSAVSGVHLSHRDLGHMNGTSFGRRLWDCGTRVSAARLDEYPSRRCIHE